MRYARITQTPLRWVTAYDSVMSRSGTAPMQAANSSSVALDMKHLVNELLRLGVAVVGPDVVVIPVPSDCIEWVER